MQKNKIDTHIADKFKDREIAPSSSAWERLSVQLDKEETKKKKNWILYLSYAASVALLISIGFYSKNDVVDNVIENTIVNTVVDTIKIKEIDLKEIVPVEEAVVKSEKTTKKSETPFKVIKRTPFKEQKNVKKDIENYTESIALNTEKPTLKILDKVDDLKIKKDKKATRIAVNSDDLLYAVTHSSEEVKEYYAKYKINRKDILKTIEKELLKSNLKINPEAILAEVEYDIEEADFQQNFLQKFKLKVSDVIVAIADRNK